MAKQKRKNIPKKDVKKKNRIIINVFTVAIALTALIAVGAASYTWYTHLRSDNLNVQFLDDQIARPSHFIALFDTLIVPELSNLGISERSIERREVSGEGEQVSVVYSIRVPRNTSLILFNQHITHLTEMLGGEVLRAVESNHGDALTMTMGSKNIPIISVILKRNLPARVTNARMAIIIDDLGIKTLEYARRLTALQQVVTLSIIPFQTNTSNVVSLCHDTGTPYILHMPMEPKDSSINPGRGAILERDGTEEIRKKLDEAIDDVRAVRGMNNHMGSRSTENTRVMEDVMEFLDEKGMFFVDSRTSRNSVAFETAQRSGLKAAEITGFIDVEDEYDKIIEQLDHYAEVASSRGVAIVIGHDRPNTVTALENKLPELDEAGITFVPVERLVR